MKKQVNGIIGRICVTSILAMLIMLMTQCERYNKASIAPPVPENQDIYTMETPDLEEIPQEQADGEVKIIYGEQLMEVVVEDIDLAFSTEEYSLIRENEFRESWSHPLSTFSIDVDKASYASIRRFMSGNQMPPKDAVRIEELINYFPYNYPQPESDQPFSVATEMAPCPWNSANRLVLIGIQGESPDYEDIKRGNYVFLVDVSGSMDSPDKLPLVKKSLYFMFDALHPDDKVALVVYAGAAGVVLPSTPVVQRSKIREAIERLSAGGSTAGGEGIRLAYQIAKENLIQQGNNRVILATDGDFNVGLSSTAELVRLIETMRTSGIYLTICGYGMGNYKDSRLEQISGAGNGIYFYIDNIREAQRVFGRDLRANLFTIARDVKIQVEFNPLAVKSYRLIGYENRVMNQEDFDNDLKDAGELGAGHCVTALYEIVPASGAYDPSPGLRYQSRDTASLAASGEFLTLKLRYKPVAKLPQTI